MCVCVCVCVCARARWLLLLEMNTVTRVQILDKNVSISHTLGKGKNPIILLPAMDT